MDTLHIFVKVSEAHLSDIQYNLGVLKGRNLPCTAPSDMAHFAFIHVTSTVEPVHVYDKEQSN